jgi:hypothetical protein
MLLTKDSVVLKQVLALLALAKQKHNLKVGGEDWKVVSLVVSELLVLLGEEEGVVNSQEVQVQSLLLGNEKLGDVLDDVVVVLKDVEKDEVEKVSSLKVLLSLESKG